PEGPVEPLDVPNLEDIPLGDGNSRIRIRDGEAVFSTEVDGIPIDIRLDDRGIGVDEQTIEAARRRAEERRREEEERYEEVRDQLETEGRIEGN
ncbi:MAG: penicillin-binding protein, partial [Erythrobacter sp.]|nr:penicillin-binding protein [Erythrobacter sp.]